MKIERINKGSWGKIRAFFDIKTEDLEPKSVYNIAILYDHFKFKGK